MKKLVFSCVLAVAACGCAKIIGTPTDVPAASRVVSTYDCRALEVEALAAAPVYYGNRQMFSGAHLEPVDVKEIEKGLAAKKLFDTLGCKPFGG